MLLSPEVRFEPAPLLIAVLRFRLVLPLRAEQPSAVLSLPTLLATRAS